TGKGDRDLSGKEGKALFDQRRVNGRRFDIELQISRDSDRPRYERGKTAAVLLVLNAEDIEDSKQPSRNKGEETQTPSRALGDLAANKSALYSRQLCLMDEIRPNIPFDKKEEIRRKS